MIVENLEEIAFNKRRKLLLERLPNIFEKLSPDRVCSELLSKTYSPESNGGSLFVIGFGKASIPMYRGVRNVLEGEISKGWIIVPDDETEKCDYPELKIFHGTHPITGKLTEDSSRKVLEELGSLKKSDTVIVLISGGGSALFEIPVASISIEDIAEASRCLMDSDANIYELNTFRKFFSAVKGGKLADYLKPAKVIGLIISDVFGDDLSMIASGPLSPAEIEGSELESLVARHSQKCPILEGMRDRLNAEDKKIRTSGIAEQHIVLRNMDFVREFEKYFEDCGLDYVSLGSTINGEVTEVSERMSGILKGIRSVKPGGFWFVFGGETTVNVSGQGEGGRNQEIAVRMMLKLKTCDFTFMSIGTDGIDGKSPAMGGIVDSDISSEISIEEAMKYLKNSDTFNLLSKHRSVIITGRTGTNVSDIAAGYLDFGDDPVEDP